MIVNIATLRFKSSINQSYNFRKYYNIHIIIAKALLQNKLDKTGDVVLCDNKAKNTGIAIAMARLFNAVSAQKNKLGWSSYFVTMPKQRWIE